MNISIDTEGGVAYFLLEKGDLLTAESRKNFERAIRDDVVYKYCESVVIALDKIDSIHSDGLGEIQRALIYLQKKDDNINVNFKVFLVTKEPPEKNPLYKPRTFDQALAIYLEDPRLNEVKTFRTLIEAFRAASEAVNENAET